MSATDVGLPSQALSPSRRRRSADSSPAARTTRPALRPENRFATTAIAAGAMALVCALVPALRAAGIVASTAGLLMGISLLGRARRRGDGADTAWVAIALAILAGVGLLASQAAFGAVAGPERPTTSVGAPSIEDAQAATTEQVLAEQLRVQVGEVAVGLDPSGLTASSLPVTVTNISGRTLTYDVEFEARTKVGKRITTDSAHIPLLAAGQSATVQVFNIVNNQLAPKFEDALFRPIKASSY